MYILYEPSNTCGPKAARWQDKSKGKMAMKTRFPGRNEAQVEAMAEGANRTTGPQEGDPRTLGEHLDVTLWEVPVVLEGHFSEAEEGRNEVTSCAFFVIAISLYIKCAASSGQRS